MLPDIPNISRVHPLVTRILGQNPGVMTLQGTNSYLIGDPAQPRVLIDTTEGSSATVGGYIPLLEEALQAHPSSSETPPLAAIMLTHWHPDHCQGVSAVQDLVHKLSPSTTSVPVYKSPEGPNLKQIGYYAGPLKALSGQVEVPSAGSQPVFLKPIFTPGHSVDHMCFALSIGEKVECIFVGDLILGHGTTIVLDLAAYMRSLEVLREFVIKCNNPDLCLFPAHGEVINDPIRKIDEYLSNRKHRITQVKDAFLQTAPDTWVRETALLEAVYPSVPENRRLPTLNNIRQALFWLKAHHESSVCIPSPVTCTAPHEVRDEKLFKEATAIARPGYLPQILKEEWQWMWTPKNTH
uniref:Lactamase_B domain-containing protein n=1 Tax=Mesocestoides corti TaxID=53468 RepID=A0A5K3EJ00_MESCO